MWCVKNMCSRLIRVSRRSLSFSLTLFFSLCVCASLAHDPAAIRTVHQFYGVPKCFPGISIEREREEREVSDVVVTDRNEDLADPQQTCLSACIVHILLFSAKYTAHIFSILKTCFIAFTKIVINCS